MGGPERRRSTMQLTTTTVRRLMIMVTVALAATALVAAGRAATPTSADGRAFAAAAAAQQGSKGLVDNYFVPISLSADQRALDAVRTTGSEGFAWGEFGIGAACAVALLLAMGTALVVRRHGRVANA